CEATFSFPPLSTNLESLTAYSVAVTGSAMSSIISTRMRMLVLIMLFALAVFGQTHAAVNTNSPAYVAAGHFIRGANCGNYLEVPPGQRWAVPHSTNDLGHMRAEGFDHVRIPVGWHHYTGPEPDFRLSSEIFAKVD